MTPSAGSRARAPSPAGETRDHVGSQNDQDRGRPPASRARRTRASPPVAPGRLFSSRRPPPRGRAGAEARVVSPQRDADRGPAQRMSRRGREGSTSPSAVYLPSANDDRVATVEETKKTRWGSLSGRRPRHGGEVQASRLSSSQPLPHSLFPSSSSFGVSFPHSSAARSIRSARRHGSATPQRVYEAGAAPLEPRDDMPPRSLSKPTGAGQATVCRKVFPSRPTREQEALPPHGMDQGGHASSSERLGPSLSPRPLRRSSAKAEVPAQMASLSHSCASGGGLRRSLRSRCRSVPTSPLPSPSPSASASSIRCLSSSAVPALFASLPDCSEKRRAARLVQDLLEARQKREDAERQVAQLRMQQRALRARVGELVEGIDPEIGARLLTMIASSSPAPQDPDTGRESSQPTRTQDRRMRRTDARKACEARDDERDGEHGHPEGVHGREEDISIHLTPDDSDGEGIHEKLFALRQKHLGRRGHKRKPFPASSPSPPSRSPLSWSPGSASSPPQLSHATPCPSSAALPRASRTLQRVVAAGPTNCGRRARDCANERAGASSVSNGEAGRLRGCLSGLRRTRGLAADREEALQASSETASLGRLVQKKRRKGLSEDRYQLRTQREGGSIAGVKQPPMRDGSERRILRSCSSPSSSPMSRPRSPPFTRHKAALLEKTLLAEKPKSPEQPAEKALVAHVPRARESSRDAESHAREGPSGGVTASVRPPCSTAKRRQSVKADAKADHLANADAEFAKARHRDSFAGKSPVSLEKMQETLVELPALRAEGEKELGREELHSENDAGVLPSGAASPRRQEKRATGIRGPAEPHERTSPPAAASQKQKEGRNKASHEGHARDREAREGDEEVDREKEDEYLSRLRTRSSCLRDPHARWVARWLQELYRWDEEVEDSDGEASSWRCALSSSSAISGPSSSLPGRLSEEKEKPGALWSASRRSCRLAERAPSSVPAGGDIGTLFLLALSAEGEHHQGSQHLLSLLKRFSSPAALFGSKKALLQMNLDRYLGAKRDDLYAFLFSAWDRRSRCVASGGKRDAKDRAQSEGDEGESEEAERWKACFSLLLAAAALPAASLRGTHRLADQHHVLRFLEISEKQVLYSSLRPGPCAPALSPRHPVATLPANSRGARKRRREAEEATASKEDSGDECRGTLEIGTDVPFLAAETNSPSTPDSEVKTARGVRCTAWQTKLPPVPLASNRCSCCCCFHKLWSASSSATSTASPTHDAPVSAVLSSPSLSPPCLSSDAAPALPQAPSARAPGAHAADNRRGKELLAGLRPTACDAEASTTQEKAPAAHESEGTVVPCVAPPASPAQVVAFSAMEAARQVLGKRLRRLMEENAAIRARAGGDGGRSPERGGAPALPCDLQGEREGSEGRVEDPREPGDEQPEVSQHRGLHAGSGEAGGHGGHLPASPKASEGHQGDTRVRGSSSLASASKKMGADKQTGARIMSLVNQRLHSLRSFFPLVQRQAVSVCMHFLEEQDRRVRTDGGGMRGDGRSEDAGENGAPGINWAANEREARIGAHSEAREGGAAQLRQCLADKREHTRGTPPRTETDAVRGHSQGICHGTGVLAGPLKGVWRETWLDGHPVWVVATDVDDKDESEAHGKLLSLSHTPGKNEACFRQREQSVFRFHADRVGGDTPSLLAAVLLRLLLLLERHSPGHIEPASATSPSLSSKSPAYAAPPSRVAPVGAAGPSSLAPAASLDLPSLPSISAGAEREEARAVASSPAPRRGCVGPFSVPPEERRQGTWRTTARSAWFCAASLSRLEARLEEAERSAQREKTLRVLPVWRQFPGVDLEAVISADGAAKAALLTCPCCCCLLARLSASDQPLSAPSVRAPSCALSRPSASVVSAASSPAPALASGVPSSPLPGSHACCCAGDSSSGAAGPCRCCCCQLARLQASEKCTESQPAERAADAQRRQRDTAPFSSLFSPLASALRCPIRADSFAASSLPSHRPPGCLPSTSVSAFGSSPAACEEGQPRTLASLRVTYASISWEPEREAACLTLCVAGRGDSEGGTDARNDAGAENIAARPQHNNARAGEAGEPVDKQRAPSGEEEVERQTRNEGETREDRRGDPRARRDVGGQALRQYIFASEAPESLVALAMERARRREARGRERKKKEQVLPRQSEKGGEEASRSPLWSAENEDQQFTPHEGPPVCQKAEEKRHRRELALLAAASLFMTLNFTPSSPLSSPAPPSLTPLPPSVAPQRDLPNEEGRPQEPSTSSFSSVCLRFFASRLRSLQRELELASSPASPGGSGRREKHPQERQAHAANSPRSLSGACQSSACEKTERKPRSGSFLCLFLKEWSAVVSLVFSSMSLPASSHSLSGSSPQPPRSFGASVVFTLRRLLEDPAGEEERRRVSALRDTDRDVGRLRKLMREALLRPPLAPRTWVASQWLGNRFTDKAEKLRALELLRWTFSVWTHELSFAALVTQVSGLRVTSAADAGEAPAAGARAQSDTQAAEGGGRRREETGRQAEARWLKTEESATLADADPEMAYKVPLVCRLCGKMSFPQSCRTSVDVHVLHLLKRHCRLAPLWALLLDIRAVPFSVRPLFLQVVASRLEKKETFSAAQWGHAAGGVLPREAKAKRASEPKRDAKKDASSKKASARAERELAEGTCSASSGALRKGPLSAQGRLLQSLVFPPSRERLEQSLGHVKDALFAQARVSAIVSLLLLLLSEETARQLSRSAASREASAGPPVLPLSREKQRTLSETVSDLLKAVVEAKAPGSGTSIHLLRLSALSRVQPTREGGKSKSSCRPPPGDLLTLLSREDQALLHSLASLAPHKKSLVVSAAPSASRLHLASTPRPSSPGSPTRLRSSAPDWSLPRPPSAGGRMEESSNASHALSALPGSSVSPSLLSPAAGGRGGVSLYGPPAALGAGARAAARLLLPQAPGFAARRDEAVSPAFSAPSSLMSFPPPLSLRPGERRGKPPLRVNQLCNEEYEVYDETARPSAGDLALPPRGQGADAMPSRGLSEASPDALSQLSAPSSSFSPLLFSSLLLPPSCSSVVSAAASGASLWGADAAGGRDGGVPVSLLLPRFSAAAAPSDQAKHFLLQFLPVVRSSKLLLPSVVSLAIDGRACTCGRARRDNGSAARAAENGLKVRCGSRVSGPRAMRGHSSLESVVHEFFEVGGLRSRPKVATVSPSSRLPPLPNPPPSEAVRPPEGGRQGSGSLRLREGAGRAASARTRSGGFGRPARASGLVAEPCDSPPGGDAKRGNGEAQAARQEGARAARRSLAGAWLQEEMRGGKGDDGAKTLSTVASTPSLLSLGDGRRGEEERGHRDEAGFAVPTRSVTATTRFSWYEAFALTPLLLVSNRERIRRRGTGRAPEEPVPRGLASLSSLMQLPAEKDAHIVPCDTSDSAGPLSFLPSTFSSYALRSKCAGGAAASPRLSPSSPVSSSLSSLSTSSPRSIASLPRGSSVHLHAAYSPPSLPPSAVPWPPGPAASSLSPGEAAAEPEEAAEREERRPRRGDTNASHYRRHLVVLLPAPHLASGLPGGAEGARRFPMEASGGSGPKTLILAESQSCLLTAPSSAQIRLTQVNHLHETPRGEAIPSASELALPACGGASSPSVWTHGLLGLADSSSLLPSSVLFVAFPAVCRAPRSVPARPAGSRADSLSACVLQTTAEERRGTWEAGAEGGPTERGARGRWAPDRHPQGHAAPVTVGNGASCGRAREGAASLGVPSCVSSGDEGDELSGRQRCREDGSRRQEGAVSLRRFLAFLAANGSRFSFVFREAAASPAAPVESAEASWGAPEAREKGEVRGQAQERLTSARRAGGRGSSAFFAFSNGFSKREDAGGALQERDGAEGTESDEEGSDAWRVSAAQAASLAALCFQGWVPLFGEAAELLLGEEREGETSEADEESGEDACEDGRRLEDSECTWTGGDINRAEGAPNSGGKIGSSGAWLSRGKGQKEALRHLLEVLSYKMHEETAREGGGETADEGRACEEGEEAQEGEGQGKKLFRGVEEGGRRTTGTMARKGERRRGDICEEFVVAHLPASICFKVKQGRPGESVSLGDRQEGSVFSRAGAGTRALPRSVVSVAQFVFARLLAAFFSFLECEERENEETPERNFGAAGLPRSSSLSSSSAVLSSTAVHVAALSSHRSKRERQGAAPNEGRIEGARAEDEQKRRRLESEAEVPSMAAVGTDDAEEAKTREKFCAPWKSFEARSPPGSLHVDERDAGLLNSAAQEEEGDKESEAEESEPRRLGGRAHESGCPHVDAGNFISRAPMAQERLGTAEVDARESAEEEDEAEERRDEDVERAQCALANVVLPAPPLARECVAFGGFGRLPDDTRTGIRLQLTPFIARAQRGIPLLFRHQLQRSGMRQHDLVDLMSFSSPSSVSSLASLPSSPPSSSSSVAPGKAAFSASPSAGCAAELHSRASAPPPPDASPALSSASPAPSCLLALSAAAAPQRACAAETGDEADRETAETRSRRPRGDRERDVGHKRRARGRRDEEFEDRAADAPEETDEESAREKKDELDWTRVDLFAWDLRAENGLSASDASRGSTKSRGAAALASPSSPSPGAARDLLSAVSASAPAVVCASSPDAGADAVGEERAKGDDRMSSLHATLKKKRRRKQRALVVKKKSKLASPLHRAGAASHSSLLLKAKNLALCIEGRPGGAKKKSRAALVPRGHKYSLFALSSHKAASLASRVSAASRPIRKARDRPRLRSIPLSPTSAVCASSCVSSACAGSTEASAAAGRQRRECLSLASAAPARHSQERRPPLAGSSSARLLAAHWQAADPELLSLAAERMQERNVSAFDGLLIGEDGRLPEKADLQLRRNELFFALESQLRLNRTAHLLEATAARCGARVPPFVVRTKLLKLGKSRVHGWGVFAAEPICKDEFVIEYSAVVVSEAMANFREWQYMQSMGGSTYLFKLKNSTIADATQSGAVTRFINHSCHPNCQTRDLDGGSDDDGRNCHVGIFALRDIAIGEELFYNYSLSEGALGHEACHCGAPGCKGVM
ncbi:hypothetical protein BESB_026760 [Besnoitia besnoiti]|uniref:SET domain-containing protein n=1 Tax=Besnoitia besnoiti TaxID=94643 RepID=A0A2A9M8I4_BESBE|nr:uncharacterized protein BESB_026760 [Besnoitia besnoiti]PFH31702.1 hypothetical protein BESB_026760 [Besnoitia besnoiti]